MTQKCGKTTSYHAIENTASQNARKPFSCDTAIFLEQNVSTYCAATNSVLFQEPSNISCINPSVQRDIIQSSLGLQEMSVQNESVWVKLFVCISVCSDVPQSALETVVPKTLDTYVRVVSGQHRGQVSYCLLYFSNFSYTHYIDFLSCISFLIVRVRENKYFYFQLDDLSPWIFWNNNSFFSHLSCKLYVDIKEKMYESISNGLHTLEGILEWQFSCFCEKKHVAGTKFCSWKMFYKSRWFEFVRYETDKMTSLSM